MNNLTEQELTKLKATKNETEWTTICDKVKATRNGQYPQDWFVKVLASGLAYKAQNSWK